MKCLMSEPLPCARGAPIVSAMAKEPQAAKSAFHHWMIRNDFTGQEAADKLGISRRQIVDYIRGTSQHTGEPLAPPYAVRILMRLIDDHRLTGKKLPKPWPDNQSIIAVFAPMSSE